MTSISLLAAALKINSAQAFGLFGVAISLPFSDGRHRMFKHCVLVLSQSSHGY